MSKITPCLWFDNQAEDAVNFYCSIFPNSKEARCELFRTRSIPIPGRWVA
jgi:predicted 3-demethylubiquinone-9 3-methyltransferase (glyoxalase superfamily)